MVCETMKTAILIILLLSLKAFAENSVIINDFENGLDGWGRYKDASSEAPELSLTDESLREGSSLKVKMNGCKLYQGIQFFKAPRMPDGTCAVSFLIKPVSGPPQLSLHLSERKTFYGKDLATASVHLAIKGSDWQKIMIPLNTFKDADRKKRGKKFTFKPGSIYLLRFNGARTDQPSIFLLDDIIWELE